MSRLTPVIIADVDGYYPPSQPDHQHIQGSSYLKTKQRT